MEYCPICHRPCIEVHEYRASNIYIHERREVKWRQKDNYHNQTWDACIIGRTGSDKAGNVTLIREGEAKMY